MKDAGIVCSATYKKEQIEVPYCFLDVAHSKEDNGTRGGRGGGSSSSNAVEAGVVMELVSILSEGSINLE